MADFTFSASADYNSQADVPPIGTPYSWQVVGADLDAADGVLSIEYSNDKANWAQVPELVETVGSGASDTHFNINIVNHKYYRLKWVAGSNTAGTFAVSKSA